MDIGNIQLTDKEIQAGNINIPVIKGAPGKDGYTPVKGKDYWTTQDKQEIVEEINQDFNDKLEAKANKEEVKAQLETKVDKEEGKGLSEENFTIQDKEKLESIVPESQAKLQGTSFHIPDSAEAPMKISPRGNDIEQETRDGYNDLKNTATSQTISDVTFTVNKDGSVLVNGTATATINFKLMENFELEDETIYTLLGAGSGSSSTTYGLLINQYYDSASHIESDYGNGVQFTYKIASKSTNSVYIYIHSGVTISNVLFKPMLLKGEYTISTAPKYEQYGAMPSLAFPSPVKHVGGSVYNIAKVNKNIFDKTRKVNNWFIYNDGQMGYYEGNSNQVYQIPIIGGKKIYISKALSDRFRACVTDKDISQLDTTNKNAGSYMFANDSITQAVINSNATDKYLYLQISSTVDNTEIEDSVQVEYDNYSDYIAHKQENRSLDLTNLPLYSKNDYIRDNKAYNEWNKYVLTGEESSLVENTATKGLFQITLDNVTTDLTTPRVLSNYLKGIAGQYIAQTDVDISVSTYSGNRIFFRINEFANNLEGFKTWLKEKYANGTPLYIIYKLAKPTETEITDETVIEVSEELYNTYAYDEVTNISVDNPILSAPLVLDVEYYIKTALGLETKVSYEEYAKLLKRVEQLEAQIGG